MTYKTNLFKITAMILLAGAVAFAQTTLTSTTTSAAMTSNQTTITLASGTGVTTSGPNNQINTVLYVDRELMWVTTLVSGTTYNVQRGKNQTRPFAHASGARVYLGPPTNAFLSNNGESAESWGACTSTAEAYLPKIYVTTGDIFQCPSSGQWIRVGSGTSTAMGSQVIAFCTGALGSGDTEYLNGAACAQTTSTASYLITRPGTLYGLYVNAGAALTGGTNKDVMTVYKNGSATAITCTVAASGTTCSDTTHGVSVVAGDRVTFQFVTATGDNTISNLQAGVGLF